MNYWHFALCRLSLGDVIQAPGTWFNWNGSFLVSFFFKETFFTAIINQQFCSCYNQNIFYSDTLNFKQCARRSRQTLPFNLLWGKSSLSCWSPSFVCIFKVFGGFELSDSQTAWYWVMYCEIIWPSWYLKHRISLQHCQMSLFQTKFCTYIKIVHNCHQQ